jgi:hypothetical protein
MGRGAQGSLSPWSHTSPLALTNPGAAERLGSHSLTHSWHVQAMHMVHYLSQMQRRDLLTTSIVTEVELHCNGRPFTILDGMHRTG